MFVWGRRETRFRAIDSVVQPWLRLSLLFLQDQPCTLTQNVAEGNAPTFGSIPQLHHQLTIQAHRNHLGHQARSSKYAGILDYLPGMTLRENLQEVEVDTQEAFDKRRELVRLLVDRIVVSRTDEGRPKVDITYRFGPPAAESAGECVYDERNSEQFWGNA